MTSHKRPDLRLVPPKTRVIETILMDVSCPICGASKFNFQQDSRVKMAYLVCTGCEKHKCVSIGDTSKILSIETARENLIGQWNFYACCWSARTDRSVILSYDNWKDEDVAQTVSFMKRAYGWAPLFSSNDSVLGENPARDYFEITFKNQVPEQIYLAAKHEGHISFISEFAISVYLPIPPWAENQLVSTCNSADGFFFIPMNNIAMISTFFGLKESTSRAETKGE